MCLVSLSYSLMRVHSATGEAETTGSENALDARVIRGSTSFMYLVQLSDSLMGRVQRDRGSRDHIQRQCA